MGSAHCIECGTPYSLGQRSCTQCGYEFTSSEALGRRAADDISDKSFGTAVALCGVFGIVGVHHFYLDNILHCVFDLGLFLAAMVCFAMGGSIGPPLAVLLLLIDVVHSLFVMVMLFIGKTRDGNGLIVAYPGQFR